MPREKCPHCQFILERCLCKSIVKLDSPIKIIIFRDRDEKKHAFNTVNILTLNLSNIMIIDLNLDLEIDSITSESLKNVKAPVLIFPTSDAQILSSSHQHFSINPDAIIFLDGTWKKTKKILFKSKTLQGLPHFKFNEINFSEYTIRQSKYDFSLSTIESVVHFLNLYDQKNIYDDLLKPFKAMISFQLEKMPKKKE